jgi:carbonic anhydrase
MTTRRSLLMGIGALGTGAAAVRAEDLCGVFTKATQSAISMPQALDRLKEGNARFVAGHTIHCNPQTQVKLSAAGQAPFAAVLGCMDSRVAPELVFDQGIGDIFAVRVAGNFVDTDVLGSLEYAADAAGAKLIVVLAHSDCGAIKGAIDHVKLGNLTVALEKVQPAIAEVTAADGAGSSKDKKFLWKVTERNAQNAAGQLITRSKVLASLVDDQKLLIVSAMHDVSTGVITWLG